MFEAYIVEYKPNGIKTHRISKVLPHYRLKTIKDEPTSWLITTVTHLILNDL